MQRAHRSAHARIWTILAILLPLTLLLAMAVHQTGPIEKSAVRLEAPGAEKADAK